MLASTDLQISGAKLLLDSELKRRVAFWLLTLGKYCTVSADVACCTEEICDECWHFIMLCLLFWKRVRDIKTIILDVFHDRLVYATCLNLDSCCMLVGLQQCYVKFTGAAVSRCLIATSDVLQPSVILCLFAAYYSSNVFYWCIFNRSESNEAGKFVVAFLSRVYILILNYRQRAAVVQG